ncbi:hypothetical protein [Micromonospora schwarzwaldensis]
MHMHGWSKVAGSTITVEADFCALGQPGALAAEVGLLAYLPG